MLSSEDDIFLAKASGHVSVKEVLRVFQNVIDTARERGFDKILMDFFAVEGELSTIELYEVGKTMAEYCVSRSIYPRVAVLGKRPTVTGFGAQVAWNRGLTSMTFSESHAALNWLRAVSSKHVGL